MLGQFHAQIEQFFCRILFFLLLRVVSFHCFPSWCTSCLHSSSSSSMQRWIFEPHGQNWLGYWNWWEKNRGVPLATWTPALWPLHLSWKSTTTHAKGMGGRENLTWNCNTREDKLSAMQIRCDPPHSPARARCMHAIVRARVPATHARTSSARCRSDFESNWQNHQLTSVLWPKCTFQTETCLSLVSMDLKL